MRSFKLLAVCLLISLTVTTMPIFAAPEYEYVINIGDQTTCTITKYNGLEPHVIVPKEIESYKVTAIGIRAFSLNPSLESVVIQEGVDKVGVGAFASCRNLKSIQLPSSTTYIGLNAFLNCSSLTNVVLPPNIKDLPDQTFWGCSSLQNIELPENLISIGGSAFKDCRSLENVKIPQSVESIQNKAFENCSSLISVQIPNQVKRIGESTFENCTGLVSVSFPSALNQIDSKAFRNCKVLADLKLPVSLVTLSESVFEGTGLTKIKIPNGVTEIGIKAFYSCGNLVSVDIPASVSKIESQAFENCSALKTLVIPLGVKELGSSAFYKTGVETITIPSSVELIKPCLLCYCPNLKKIYVDGTPRLLGELCAKTNPEILTPSSSVISNETGIYTYRTTTGAAFSLSTAPSIVGGTITPSMTRGMVGEMITLVITPNPGFYFDQSSLKYSAGMVETPIAGISFVMPNKDVVVKGVFKPMLAPTITGSLNGDVLTWNWGDAGQVGEYRYMYSKPWFVDTTVSNLVTTVSAEDSYSIDVEEYFEFGGWSPMSTCEISGLKTALTANLTRPSGDQVSLEERELEISFNETVALGSPSKLSIDEGTKKYVCTLAPNELQISGTGGSCKLILPIRSFECDSKPLTLEYGKTYRVSLLENAFRNQMDKPIVAGDIGVFATRKMPELASPLTPVAFEKARGATAAVVPPIVIEAEKLPMGSLKYTEAYVQGDLNGKFNPNEGVTRAQLAVMLACVLKLEAQENGNGRESTFTDIENSHWANKSIEAVTRLGLFKGHANNRFDPDQIATRAEVANVLVKYLEGANVKIENQTAPFLDVKGSWANNSINKLYSAGITSGFEDKTFRPNENANRAQVVVMVNKLLGRKDIRPTKPKFKDVDSTYWAYGAIEAAGSSEVK